MLHEILSEAAGEARRMESERGQLLLENRTLKDRLAKLDEAKVEATIKDLRGTASARLREKEVAVEAEKKALAEVDRIRGEMKALKEAHTAALAKKDEEIKTLRDLVKEPAASVKEE